MVVTKALTEEDEAFIPWLNRYLDRVTDIQHVADKPGSTFSHVDIVNFFRPNVHPEAFL